MMRMKYLLPLAGIVLMAIHTTDCELLAVELDGDVLGTVLLHVERQLVLVTLLDFEEDRGLGHLGGGGRDVVLGLVDLVIHLRGRGHGRRGHRVLGLAGGGAGGRRGHVRHLLEAQPGHGGLCEWFTAP